MPGMALSASPSGTRFEIVKSASSHDPLGHMAEPDADRARVLGHRELHAEDMEAPEDSCDRTGWLRNKRTSFQHISHDSDRIIAIVSSPNIVHF